MLSSSGFNYVECLLSPTQFGVPNSRTRYYLIAKKCTDNEQSSRFGFEYKDGELITEGPRLLPTSPLQVPSFTPFISNFSLSSVLDTLDTLYSKYRVCDKVLAKRFNVLDIVNPSVQARTVSLILIHTMLKINDSIPTGTGSVLSSLEDMDTIEHIINQAKQLVRDKPDEKNDDIDTQDENKAKRIKLDSEDIETDENKSEVKVCASVDETKTVNTENGVTNLGKVENVGLETNESGSELQNKVSNQKRKSEAENIVEDIKISDDGNRLENENITSAGDVEKSLIDGKTHSENNAGKYIKTTTHENTTKLQKELQAIDDDKLATKTYLEETKESPLVKAKHIENTELLALLHGLNLRYFTPNEIRKLMCFPDDFQFPDSCSDKSRYKLLGNSINIHVVAYCICLMLS
ncbi:hypothetical protein WDU94_007549 [Cyamophila willieti]